MSPLPYPQRFARIALGISAAVGLSGVIGWATGIGLLQRFHPAWNPMSANTSIGLVLTSIALWLIRDGGSGRVSRSLAQVLAGAVGFFAMAALLRTTFGLDTGWFASPFAPLPPLNSETRLPINTVLPFLVSVGAILVMTVERKSRFGLANWLGLAVMSFSTLTMAGRLLTDTPGRMAMASSIGFLALGGAILCLRIDRGLTEIASRRHPLGLLASVLLGIGFAVPLIMYAVAVSWLTPGEQHLNDWGLFIATLSSATVFGLLALALRRMETLDQQRRSAESARDLLFARLQQQTATLEELVGVRTRELQKTTERLDLALRAGGFGVWDWDLAGKRVYWDHHQCELYGYTTEEFDGTTGAWLSRIHPGDREPVEMELGRSLSAQDHFESDFRIILPGGGERHIQSLGAFRRDSGGRVVRIVGIDRDVTEDHTRSRELASVNDRLQLAIQATGYGVWELDLSTRRMFWDDRMLEIYGLRREEFGGHADDWHMRVLPEDAARDDERIADAIARRTPIYQSTFRIRRPDGSIRHIEALGLVQRDREGEPLRIVGLDRDITEASELAERLRISEERWQLALTGSNDGVWDWDLTTGKIYRDARYAAMMGYTPEDLPQTPTWLEFGHPEDVPAVETAIRHHIEARTAVFQCEFRLRHRAGHWIWVLSRGKVVERDAAGKALRLVGTQADITQRKELEERLRHGEEMSLQLSRLAQIGAWEWDLSTAKLTWSPEMFRIIEVELGFEPTLERYLQLYPFEARRTLTEAMEHAVRAGTGFDLELPFNTARGHKLWVRVLGRAQLKEGRTTRVYGAFQDITARRDAEDMRRQLEGQLFQAQKMETLGTLAGGIAHDFNNLLTGILGYQDLALDSLAEDDQARSYLASSREASLRARELVDQILTFGRQADSEKVPVNLAQVVEDARRFLRATVPATIRIDVDTAAECGRVLADATQIHQVLLNLGSNAAHAMRATGGTMLITLAPVSLDEEEASKLGQLAAGNYVRLEFTDTGHGMNEETQKRIFDPFFTTKEVGQGTGLGLSVVHGILQAHRGAITVRSAPGQGSTFTLFLPVASSMAVEQESKTDAVPRGQGELIAVVDDEDIVRSFAQMALERTGYRVAAFDSPAHCLDVLRRNAADYRLLLTDQTMPVMKGIELAAEVRSFAPDLPVVIMSGYFSRISPEMLAQIGHVALLSKPFTNEELARAVGRALHDEPAAAE